MAYYGHGSLDRVPAWLWEVGWGTWLPTPTQTKLSKMIRLMQFQLWGRLQEQKKISPLQLFCWAEWKGWKWPTCISLSKELLADAKKEHHSCLFATPWLYNVLGIGRMGAKSDLICLVMRQSWSLSTRHASLQCNVCKGGSSPMHELDHLMF